MKLVFAIFFVCWTSIALAGDPTEPLPTFHELIEAETAAGMPMDLLRYDDALKFGPSYAQSGDLVESFVRIIFPITGRQRRTMFLPLSYWGKKKPSYTDLTWKRFESAHFDFYTYPDGEAVLPDVVQHLEEEHERNNRIFGVENRFIKKIPVIYYQTRRDFEQTHIVEGPIPESLGGLTEIISWRRVTFPFEGEKQKFAHVSKHEGTHVYQIAKGARRLPLWFIEGSAETNSIKWDAEAEMTIRDAFVNGFYFHLEDLWQIQGTWLMYKQGNFTTNLIWDEFGEEGFRKIYDRGNSKDFADNLKESVGLTLEDLDNKVFAALGKRYGDLLTRKDLIDDAREIDKKKMLLDSHGPFFVSGGAAGPRNALFINHLADGRKLVRKEIVSDRRIFNESLGFFQKGASLDDQKIVYVIKKSERDVLRVVPYSFDSNKRKFHLKKESEYSFPELPILSDPAILSETKVAFIGLSKGFSNLYVYDWKSGKLEPLTTGRQHYSGLDYSPVRNELVFSREDGPTSEKAHFDRNLYALNLGSKEVRPLTQTKEIREDDPRFMPDGKSVLYVADADVTFDLFQLDLETGETSRLSKMNVGALHPNPAENGGFLFNGFKRMSPTIYLASLPSADKRLSLEMPVGRSQAVVVQEGGPRLAPIVPTPLPEVKATPVPEGLQFMEEKAIIGFEQYPFHVRSAARLGDQVVFLSERGLPESKRVELDDREHYFVLGVREGMALESLSSSMVARKRFPETLEKILGDKLVGRPVIRGWVSHDEKKGLVLVNNRLAKDYEAYREKPDVGVVLYDFPSNAVTEIESGPLEDLSDQLQWVTFLTEEKILLAVGEKPFQELELHFYDGKKKKYEELDFGVGHFRVSPDHSRVAWLRGSTIYYRDTSMEKDHTVSGLGSWGEGNVAFDFLKDNALQIFTVAGEKWIRHRFQDPLKTPVQQTLSHSEKERVLAAAMDRETGDITLRVTAATKSGVPERLLFYSHDGSEPKDISGRGIRYGQVAFRNGYLTFTEQRRGAGKDESWVWRDGKRARFDRLAAGAYLPESTLLLQTDQELYTYEAPGRSVHTISGSTAGYAVNGQKIIYSALAGEHFQLFEHDRKSRQSKPLAVEKRHGIDPNVIGSKLVWAAHDGSRWIIKEASLGQPMRATTHELEGYDLIRPEEKDGAIRAMAFPKPSIKTYESSPWEQGFQPGVLQGHPTRTKFKLQSLMAGAAFDGSDFRFFITGFADNLFSDVGMFVNAAFLNEDKFASVSYVDLVREISYSFRYNSSEEISDYGFELAKSIIFDRYRELSLFSQFEIQDYGQRTVRTLKYVTPEIENRTFYVLKGGAAYAYDVTIWDHHGPISGSRFFFRTEAGWDIENTAVANVDANLDARIYNEILPRFGFATRVVGGTSQGDLPSVYLIGGNVSFRGFGFDDIEGQNYWVASEDMRVPLFDVLGAKFFDPLDQVLGLFTRYFDIRGGLYGDIGSAWYNDDDFDIDYSVGYFFNIPTIFGLTFRFSQGFYGGDAINIWFGGNW